MARSRWDPWGRTDQITSASRPNQQADRAGASVWRSWRPSTWRDRVRSAPRFGSRVARSRTRAGRRGPPHALWSPWWSRCTCTFDRSETLWSLQCRANLKGLIRILLSIIRLFKCGCWLLSWWWWWSSCNRKLQVCVFWFNFVIITSNQSFWGGWCV